MNLNAFVVNVGGQKSLVFGADTAEQARDEVLRTSYTTEVGEATESDLNVISRVELLAIYKQGGIQVRPATKPRKPSEPKYRHPEDESKVWTGRGRAPAWFQALLDAGHSKESLAIPGTEDEPADEVQAQSEF